MSERVFDASVYLADALGEPLRIEINALLDGSVISAVNLAEVLAKQKELGIDPLRLTTLLSQIKRIEPFTESQARLAAALRPLTSHAGLSLADRACLALAIELGAEVYTADRIWATLDLPCKFHLIR